MEEDIATFFALEVEGLDRESRNSVKTVGLNIQGLVNVDFVVAATLVLQERVLGGVGGVGAKKM